ncbi:MAG: MFS transporter [Deltaproteobacteria bacterium]|nr:MFS transporter [Deltaproteobacteria bacterium]
MKKPLLNLLQMFNMSFGFFGIQHGFEIQFARMTPLFETLGAGKEQVPFLWLAAPFTGLIIQPIVGYASDRTWWQALRCRRRPYFFIGAVLSTLSLFAMPHAGAVWMAAGLLWVLDASLNICMEPMRAFVGDKLSSGQRPQGYAWQAFMIGAGTIIGNFIASATDLQTGFYLCGTILFFAMSWTVFSSPEYPPDDVGKQAETFKGPMKEVAAYFVEVFGSIKEMPEVMKVLGVVQFLTWMGLFCMWIFYSSAVGANVFGGIPTAPTQSTLYQNYEQGVRFAARTLAFRGMITPLYALLIPLLCLRIGRAYTHSLSLMIGAIGLLLVPFSNNRGEAWMLYLFAIGSGIAWASIVSMPYTILVEHLPQEKYGLFMGLFNMFIVLPEICVSLGMGTLMLNFVGGNRAWVVGIGGVLLFAAGIVTTWLRKYDHAPLMKT